MAELSPEEKTAVYDVLFDPVAQIIIQNRLTCDSFSSLTLEQGAKVIANGLTETQIVNWIKRYRAQKANIARLKD